MRHLLVEDADKGTLFLTLTAGNTQTNGVAEVPHFDLLRTGVAELLVSGRDAELAGRAGRYASILADSLERALEHNIQLAIGGLRVEVRCSAATQSLIWEALRLLGDEAGPVHVFRTLPGLEAAPDAIGGCELIWLAARRIDDKIPRYRIAGPVLAEILVSGTIMPRWVSTGSTPELVRSLPRRVPPAPGRARIVHLDVHGGTRTRPDDDLLDAGFVAQFGAEVMDDRELETILDAAGCTVFVSNACHSGDLRDIRRLPFPARLLTHGSAAALVARGPVPEQSATRFHRYLYAALARGATLLDAHAGAVDHGAALWPGDRDQRAQAVVQPMMWVRASVTADEPLCGPRNESELSEGQLIELSQQFVGTAQLHITAEDGVLASVMTAAERELAADRPMPQPVFTDRDLTEDSARSMAETTRWALGAGTEPTGSTPLPVLSVPPLWYEERRALLRQLFGSTSPLLDVLAACSSGDPSALAATAVVSERDPVRALLRAGEMGQTTGEGSPIMAEGAAAARTVLAPFSDDPLFRATLAVPLLGVGTDCELAGEWIPPAPSAWIDHVDGRDGRITVVQHGDHHFLRPDRSVRDAARVLTPPLMLARLRMTPAWRGPKPTFSRRNWDTASARACATLLVLAVAARQAQLIDLYAVAGLIKLIGSVSHRATAQLVGRMREGLPDWPPIDPQLAPTWDELVTDLTGLNATTSPLLDASDEEGTDRERARKLAYEVARGDDPAQALGAALEMIATASLDDRSDYCECLHLLGEVQQRLGRPQLAAEMFLKERAVDPPADHRRLHNRDHLYGVVFGIEPRDDDLLFTVAMEGVEIARGSGDAQTEGRLLTRALVCGLNASQDEWLRRAIDDAQANAHVSQQLLHLASGYLHIDDDPAGAVPELMTAAAGHGTYAAHASLLLTDVDPDNAEDHLRRGARTVNGGMYQELCLDTLLIYLMHAGRVDEVRTELVSLTQVPRDRPPFWYARAGLAYFDGDPKFNQCLVDAIATDGGKGLSLLGGMGIPAADLPLQAVVDAIVQLTGLLQDPDTTPVTPLAAADNVARLARLLDAQNRRWAVGRLSQSSERAWDQQSASSLALAVALRSYACDLLAELGDPDDLAMLAEEMSWLATLNRVRGRPTEAEELFQRAIALAHEYLPPFQVGSIISRYGNLLHDLGENAAAAHLHWTAVRTALADLELPASPTPETVTVALAAVDAVGSASPQRGRWNLMLVNLANTLTDHGQVAPARTVINWMARQIEAGHRLDGEVQALMTHVAARLASPVG